MKPIALTVSLVVCLATASGQTQRPPNVLLIAIDDLNDWVGCLGGHPQAQTPNIDRLVRRGVLFTNAHCQAPLCGPSRASFLSGLYPHTTGMYQQPVRNALENDQEHFRGRLLPEYFANHGYHTLAAGKITHGYAGKTAFQEYAGGFDGFGPYPPKRKRFHYFLPDVPWTGTLTDWGAFPKSDAAMSDHKVADWASQQLRREFQRPFFMGVGFVRPHVPFYVPQHWFDRFPLTEIQLPEVRNDDLADVPPIGRAIHEVPKYPDLRFLQAGDSEQFRRCVQAYLACIAFVDHQVGRVVQALDDSDYSDNTIVVLLSDHGYHLGEKNRVCKHSLWEEATHVPLCFVDLRPDSRKKIGTAARSSVPVGLIDVYPTLTDLCGLPHNSTNQGESLAEILKFPQRARLHRRGILTTYARNNHSLRTERFRYIRYEDGSCELYDHSQDPNEWRNVAGDPGYAAEQSRLDALLPSFNADYHPATSTKPINEWFQKHFSNQSGLQR